MSFINATIKRFLKVSTPRSQLMEPAAAYDLWAKTYDGQPRNLMFHLEGQVFTGLLSQVDLCKKTVVDVGCGSGRHWTEIMKAQPADLVGYDVSAEMLRKLREKFPGARNHLSDGTTLNESGDGSADAIISTLALAHIEQIAAALREWNRVLKIGGDVLITDYHPAALGKGADRTFRHDGKTIAIKNFTHPIHELRQIVTQLGWREIAIQERTVDGEVKHFYQEQNALQVYERFHGIPIVYGWHLTRA